MIKNIKKLPIGAIALLCTLLVLVVCWISLEKRIENDSSNPFILEYKGELSDPTDVRIRLKAAKSWVNNAGLDNQTVGAQYDGYIVNDGGSDIENWRLIITLPQDGELDSAWNGSYSLEGQRLVVTPDENTYIIPAGESKTFGFVMISDKLLKFSQFELVGYRQTTHKQYPIFWIIMVSAGIWLVGFLSYLVVSVRMRTFERRREKDEKIITQTMKTFAGLIDAKDIYTKGHSTRVAIYSQELGRRIGMKKEDVQNLAYIGLMHDCGKIGVPDSVLTKTEKLDAEDRKKLEEHTTRGGYILENFTAIEGIRDGALYHHERYDGKGYPQGLKGSEIPLCARIICVADAYDAMNSDRCYRSRLPREKIVKELDENAGKQFDPDVVAHMLAMIREGFCDNPKRFLR